VCQAAYKRHRSVSQEENIITITKIYNDEGGQSHFGSIKIKLKGSGELPVYQSPNDRILLLQVILGICQS